MQNKNRTPHDTFFQLMLENKEIAIAFFKANLPTKLVAMINWRTLVITDAVVRPEGKKALYTDITYHAYTLAPQGSVYLHIEQESTINTNMPERTDDYLAAIHLKHFKQGHTKLPIVAQMVLYSGKGSNYPDPADLSLRFERPDLVPLVGNVALQPFILIDLNKCADTELAAQGPCGLMTLLLKHSDRKDLLSWMLEHKALLRSLTTAQRMIVTIFDYIYSVSEEETKKIMSTFEAIYPEQKNKIVSAKNRDIKAAMQTVAQKMLHQLQLGIDVVKQATGLSDRELSQLVKG